ncbi:MAG: PhoH family protein [Bacteroidetes bacterium]|nr:PhoH family protein [Bacteroidota bacterium]
MAEKIIEINQVDPVQIYGINDTNLELIKKRFPKLKIVARGDRIKVTGDDNEVNQFEMVLNLLLDKCSKSGTISESQVEQVLNGGTTVGRTADVEEGADIIVFGNNGLVVKARTPNQRRMLESSQKNDMMFAIGPAGTGKTYTAVALAVKALRDRTVKKIILTRPAVEAGEHLGFLPGDLKEKLDPYLQPLYDALYDMIPPEKLKAHLENYVIQIAPLAFMRGRTLDHAFVILDEAQNATESQLKMFLTRMGSSAKFVVTGDVTQIDLPKHQPSGLMQAVRLLKDVEGIDFVYLDESDVLRHKLVSKILSVYDKEK